MTLQPLLGPWPLFQFRNSIHSWKDSLDGGSARHKARYLHTNTENTHTDIHARARFEPTTPLFERSKTVHALGRAATVIGI
jgi:hypothetical protein